MASLWLAFRCHATARPVQKFHVGVEKLPGSRREVGAMASRILDMGIKPGASCDDCRISGCDCSNARKLSGANLPYYGREDFNIFAPLPLNSVTKLERALAQRAGPEPSFRPAAVSLSHWPRLQLGPFVVIPSRVGAAL